MVREIPHRYVIPRWHEPNFHWCRTSTADSTLISKASSEGTVRIPTKPRPLGVNTIRPIRNNRCRIQGWRHCSFKFSSHTMLQSFTVKEYSFSTIHRMHLQQRTNKLLIESSYRFERTKCFRLLSTFLAFSSRFAGSN